MSPFAAGAFARAPVGLPATVTHARGLRHADAGLLVDGLRLLSCNLAASTSSLAGVSTLIHAPHPQREIRCQNFDRPVFLRIDGNFHQMQQLERSTERALRLSDFPSRSAPIPTPLSSVCAEYCSADARGVVPRCACAAIHMNATDTLPVSFRCSPCVSIEFRIDTTA